MSSALGRKVREARKARGWSLRETERHTGVQNAHLAQIESGKIARPSMPVLWLLHTGLDLDYQELLRLSGHMTKSAEGDRVGRLQRAGVMMRQIEHLTPEEQDQLLEWIEEKRRSRGG